MKVLKRIATILFALICILILAYLLGPKAKFEEVDNTPLSGTYSIQEVQQRIAERNKTPGIKSGNQEEIIWADYNHKTRFSVVYLHGFSASHEEGAPINRNIAKYFRANLFLTRLPKHGLNDTEAFTELTPRELVEYAKEAIKIGKSIGDNVIVMSCSTGGTLSAYLAAKDPDIDALVMFAPNFELNDGSSKLLTKPWGLQIARQIKGGDYHEWPAPDKARPYWYHKYRLEGLVALQALLDKTMKQETFEAIDHPTFIGYFYENEENRDFTISVDKIKEVEGIIKTPSDSKLVKSYPDGSAHVLVSPLFNDDWEKIQADVELFLGKVFDYSYEMTEKDVLRVEAAQQ